MLCYQSLIVVVTISILIYERSFETILPVPGVESVSRSSRSHTTSSLYIDRVLQEPQILCHEVSGFCPASLPKNRQAENRDERP